MVMVLEIAAHMPTVAPDSRGSRADLVSMEMCLSVVSCLRVSLNTDTRGMLLFC